MRAVIISSPPAWTSSAGMLSTPADFPFFDDCTAASFLCEGWGGHPLCMKRAKENWIGEQCSEIEENLRKNNSKRAYQLVKDLTTETGENDYCQRSFRKTPHRRATDTEPMDRILL